MPKRATPVTPPLIYVDACVYLDLIVKNERPHKDTGLPRWQSARELFDAIDHGRARLGASPSLRPRSAATGRQERDHTRWRSCCEPGS